ncbi:hypothetical protein J6590_027786 [Homalodisca vitripennis]|nr:hypothetical protein J6590_027785 [Homalodisca vitripennis]KAG8253751.1 hypothetical protein J6590_027786 [Homalodisca vitripennis]
MGINKRPCAVEVAVVEADVTDLYRTSLRLRSAGRPTAEPATATRAVISYDKLNDILANMDWTDIYRQNNASVAYDLFEINIQSMTALLAGIGDFCIPCGHGTGEKTVDTWCNDGSD